jgi:hypothetical protein
MIKISERLFSFPPYLVTSWEHVSSLEGRHQPDEKVVLLFHMNTGLSVELPALAKSTVEAIFVAFQNYHEQRQIIRLKLKSALASSAMNFPLPLAEGSAMGLGLAIPLSGLPNLASGASALMPLIQNLRHNPQLKDLPSLPSDLLEKIAYTARELFNQDPDTEMPTPVAGCHCMHCQMARAIQTGIEQAGERVDEHELRFSTWHIHSLSPVHYLVVSTNDPSQCFDVKLKPEIACSCGMPTCPHIEAVLRS